jgi:hypothetical protein
MSQSSPPLNIAGASSGQLIVTPEANTVVGCSFATMSATVLYSSADKLRVPFTLASAMYRSVRMLQAHQFLKRLRSGSVHERAAFLALQVVRETAFNLPAVNALVDGAITIALAAAG